MIVRLYGFDWIIYKERIMPALAAWLVDDNAAQAHQLFLHTRCAQEEQAVPAALRSLATWPRSQAFVQRLPRGSHMQREYALLCSAEQFTRLSDHYVHIHTPQLHQNAEALRTIWGALIETYCLPWFHLSDDEPARARGLSKEERLLEQEIMALLRTTGLNELAQQISTQEDSMVMSDEDDQELPLAIQEASTTHNGAEGVIIGRLPMTLHLRGWLAGISVRAMALFELLACGRRCMPFGYQPGYPFGSYIGYLTPDEVWQIALCLRGVQPPDQVEAEADYIRFQALQTKEHETFHLIDEVLPMYAAPFLKATQIAARQGLGLICSVG